MLLKFVSDAFYNGVIVFKKDEIHEISDELGYASRWVRRGIAIPIESEVDFSKKEEYQEIPKKIETRGRKKAVKPDIGSEVL